MIVGRLRQTPSLEMASHRDALQYLDIERLPCRSLRRRVER